MTFGRRPGTAGRPAFGVAKPMQNWPRRARRHPVPRDRAAGRHPADAVEPVARRRGDGAAEPAVDRRGDGARKGARASKPASTRSRNRCCRACSNASTPRPRATLSKDELTEEFRPIILEVLAELRITLRRRREQFALEGARRRTARLRSARGAARPTPTFQRHHGQAARTRPISNARASWSSRRSSSATNSICSRSRSASATWSAAASTRPPRSPTLPPQGRQPRQRDRAAAEPARYRDLDS